MKGREAELVAKKYLEEQGYAVHLATPAKVKRGKLWITLSNDIFGCIDIMAIRSAGESVRFVQVTTPNGVTARKRKMEKLPWPVIANVEIWETRSRKNVRDARKTDYFFRVHWYNPTMSEYRDRPVWVVRDPIEIPESCLPRSRGRQKGSKGTSSERK